MVVRFLQFKITMLDTRLVNKCSHQILQHLFIQYIQPTTHSMFQTMLNGTNERSFWTIFNIYKSSPPSCLIHASSMSSPAPISSTAPSAFSTAYSSSSSSPFCNIKQISHQFLRKSHFPKSTHHFFV